MDIPRNVRNVPATTSFFNFYNILFIVIILLVFLIIGYMVWRGTTGALDTQYKNISNGSNMISKNGSGPIDIYIFYATWCPHCKTALPKWKSFSDNVNGTVVNGRQISTHTIDCTDSNDPNIANYLSKYGIKGFPTVKGVLNSGKTVINFDAAINENTLNQFVQQLVETV
jgi:thiol-disulfide isomerase/thioredoxin